MQFFYIYVFHSSALPHSLPILFPTSFSLLFFSFILSHAFFTHQSVALSSRLFERNLGSPRLLKRGGMDFFFSLLLSLSLSIFSILFLSPFSASPLQSDVPATGFRSRSSVLDGCCCCCCCWLRCFVCLYRLLSKQLSLLFLCSASLSPSVPSLPRVRSCAFFSFSLLSFSSPFHLFRPLSALSSQTFCGAISKLPVRELTSKHAELTAEATVCFSASGFQSAVAQHENSALCCEVLNLLLIRGDRLNGFYPSSPLIAHSIEWLRLG